MSEVRITKIEAKTQTKDDTTTIAVEVFTTEERAHGMAFIIPRGDTLSVQEVVEGLHDFADGLAYAVVYPQTTRDRPFALTEIKELA